MAAHGVVVMIADKEDIYKTYPESSRGADHLRRVLEDPQTIANDALAAAPERVPGGGAARTTA
jgi:hypothetical protein